MQSRTTPGDVLVMQAGAALTGKKVDIPEEQTLAKYKAALGERFDHAPASVGAGRQFASAYHIKVAVRDGKAFWLSSGNWQSSNQPNHELAVGGTSWDLLTGYNRERHAVIENTRLARQFEQFIEYDLKNAKADAVTEASLPPTEFFLIDEAIEERVWAGTPTYFPPLRINRKVRVRPLLTPDNYQVHVLDLINTASDGCCSRTSPSAFSPKARTTPASPPWSTPCWRNRKTGWTSGSS